MEDRWKQHNWDITAGFRLNSRRRPDVLVLDGDVDDKTMGPFSDYLRYIHDLFDWESLDDPENEYTFHPDLQTRTVHQMTLDPRVRLAYHVNKHGLIYTNLGLYSDEPTTQALYHYHFFGREGSRAVNVGNPALLPRRVFLTSTGVQHNGRIVQTHGYLFWKESWNEPAQRRFTAMDYTIRDKLKPGKSHFIYGSIAATHTYGANLELSLTPTSWFSWSAAASVVYRSLMLTDNDIIFEHPDRPGEKSFDRRSYEPRPQFKSRVLLHTPSFWGPDVWGIGLFGDTHVDLFYVWRAGETLTWKGDQIRWRPYQRFDLRFSKKLFRLGSADLTFYVNVHNLFNHKNMNPPANYRYDEHGNLFDIQSNWTWDAFPYWKNEFLDYMNSLNIAAGDRPGDYPRHGKNDHIRMPAFSSWTFLEKRQMFFGLYVNFN